MKTPDLDPGRTGLLILPCLTRVEFAAVLHVSLRTVDRIIAAKEIRVRRIRGKAMRILRSDVERYLNAR
jgi:excisionase family DNA binding protein